MQTLYKYLNLLKSLEGRGLSPFLVNQPYVFQRPCAYFSTVQGSLMQSKYFYTLMLMLCSIIGLKAYDRAPMANFGAGNYPCNTKMPWVDSSFTGLNSSVIDPASDGLACVGSNTNLANLRNNSLSDFASINFVSGLGGCSSTLSVVDTDVSDTYPVGTFAGYRIGTAGLVGVSIGLNIVISTYNNGSFVESQTVVSSGLGLNSSLINGDGTATLGFITTVGAFDEIRITYTAAVALLFTGTVYHAVVQRYCAGPSLACNTQTRMNNPTFPTAIDGSNTGLSGGVCVGCSVNNAENAISSSTADFATIVLTAALGTTGSIAVKDQVTDYVAGTFAGFDIENPSLINANLLSGITVRTYYNGSPQEVSNSGTLLSLSSSLLTGSGKQTVGFVTTLPFDEVKLEVTNLLGVAQTTNVYGAVFQSFCAGPNLDCNVQTTIATPTYPVLINGVRTGITGVACVACSVDSTQNLIDNVTGNSARINLTAGVGAIGSISVKEQITDYPAGTFAGFDIENTALLDVSLLGGITITTYLNGTQVESKTGTGALLAVNTGLLTNNGRRTVGFITTGAFDEVRISVSNTLSVNLGITRVYSLVLTKFCPVVLACNTTYYLNGPTFPVIINDERTGVEGLACVGCSVQNTPNVISSNDADFSTITVVAGVAGSASISVKDVLTTFPAGSTAGFVIRDINTLLQLELFNSITISTYNNGTLQESRSGNNLLDLAVLNLLNVTLTGANDYNIGFRTTLPYDEIRISVGSLASVINIIQVYGAFVDTRGSQDGNLNCCPTTAPLLSANTISNSCPTVTVNLNSLVTNLPAMGADSTVRWFTNNTATGTRYATPTMAVAGTYYAFFFDTIDSCYGPASGAVTVTINPCPPTITSDGGGATASISVPENTTAVTTVVATDPENGAITYSISGGADQAKFSINPSTGVLTFNTAPDFENPTDAGLDNVYDVQVTATDPTNASDVQDIAVTVTNVLEAPIISSNGGGNSASVSVPENTTAVTTVVATDPDNGAITYSISGGADAALFSIDPMTGVLTFNTAPDFENPADVGTDNVYNIQVTATDPSNATDVQSIAVTVTNVNEAPSITSDGAGATATIPVAENTTAVTTVTATDPENAYGTPKFSINGGADAALFTINATTGALSFNTAPNFENPTDANTDNNYEVTVRVTDAGGLFDEQAITVPVTNVLEDPIISSNGGGNSASVSIPENTTAVTTVVATDPDNGAITYSISGGADAALFSIDPMTGVLTFITAPDFETPADAGLNNVYNVQVTATDPSNATDVQNIAVTVTDVPEAGPALVCNTPTRMNNPTYPTVINGANTGLSGTLCVLCAVNNPGNAVSSSTTDFASIILTAGVAATGSLSIQDPATDYPAGTFVGFDIENTSLVGTDLLDRVTITTYLNGTLVESFTGQSALISVGSSILTDNGRRVIGFISTGLFDEARISFSNTVLINLGTTRVYGAVFESFCGTTLECNETYALNNPEFSVIVDDALSGLDGVACVACSVADAPNAISADTTDFSTLTVITGTSATASLAVKDVLNTFPAGSTVGFTIRDVNTLAQVNLLSSISVCTYNNGVQQECTTGNGLLDLSLLNSINASLNGAGDYNLGFRSTLAYDEVRITISAVAGVSNIIQVYGAFVDTRGANDGNLNCCPTTAPLLSANTISNSCPAVTVDLNSLVTNLPAMGADSTVVWFTNNGATGTAYATPTMAVAGTYYAFFFDTIDSCYGPASGAVTVTINPCAPTITSDGGGATASISVPENTTAVTTVVATDPENGAITYSISGGADAAKFSIDPMTGVLVFNMAPDFENPTDAGLDNVYDVQVTATDPTNASDVQDIAVTVTNVLEDPIITSNGGGNSASVSVAENTTAVTTVVATDPDNGAITYSISGGADAALFSIDPMTGVLTFNTAPDFENPTDAGTDNVYNIQVTATDPSNATDVQSIAVTVTNVNEAPSITSDGAGATANIPVAENTTAVTTVTATDPENAYGTPKFSITGGADAALFTINATTGALSFNTAPNFENPTDANTDNNYEVTVRVTDAGGLFDEQAITVPVTNVLEDPIISSNGGGNSASISIPENTTAVTTVVATDPDNGAITYSISGGADAALFSIDPMTGVLTFITAPDFETPADAGLNNVYNVQVTATDPSNATDVQNIAVTVTDVPESGPALPCNTPTLMNNPAYPTVINGANTGLSGTLCVLCAVNNPGNAISSSTTDFASIILTAGVAATGSLSIQDPATDYPAGTFVGFDIENTSLVGTDLLDRVTITTYLNGTLVESFTGQSALLSVGSSILTDNGRRVIGFISTGLFDEAQISFSNTVLINLGTTRVYGAVFESFCGTTLECNETYALNNPEFSVIVDDALSGLDGVACVACSVADAPNAISADTTDYSTLTVITGTSATASLAVKDVLNTFPAGSTVGFAIRDVNTLAQVNLLSSISVCTYNNGVQQECATGNGLLDLSLLNAINASLNGAGDYNLGFRSTLAYDEVRITISAVAGVSNIIQVYGAFVDTRGANDGNLNCCPTTAPLLSANTISNSCPSVTVDLNSLVTNLPAMGADSTVVWFTNNGATGTAYATPTMAVAGTYYAFFFDTIDSCYGPASGAVTVTINPCPPTITSDGGGATASISVPENTTAVTTVVATDPENGAITYSISGGADAAKFSIDPMTGVLVFNMAPDFENPTDAGLDNVYDVQVTATDPLGGTDVQDIAVTVTDVNEAPSITSNGGGVTATIPVAENTTAVTTVTATDPENLYGTPKFSITGGADAAKFSIDPLTGVLIFNTAPDFDVPTDANADNNYEVQVTVTDAGNLTDVQDITVSVTDANENGQLSVKVLLQGALFNSPTPGVMRDNLRAGNYIPLNDPYTGSGNPRFAHAGAGGLATTTAGVLSANAGTNDAIVDWVFVELRSASDSTVVVETRAALLQRDGDVVSPADGTSPLVIPGTAGNSYFVAVKHRNHLGVMTATEQTITLVGAIVDFITMSDANVYNFTSPFSYDGAERVTINGFKALWAGNANADKKVKYQGPTNDNAAVLSQVLTFPGNTLGVFNYDLALGYFFGDLNMDGKVKYQGTTNDPGFMFLNLITNFVLNSLDLYNYDLFTEQIP